MEKGSRGKRLACFSPSLSSASPFLVRACVSRSLPCTARRLFLLFLSFRFLALAMTGQFVPAAPHQPTHLVSSHTCTLRCPERTCSSSSSSSASLASARRVSSSASSFAAPPPPPLALHCTCLPPSPGPPSHARPAGQRVQRDPHALHRRRLCSSPLTPSSHPAFPLPLSHTRPSKQKMKTLIIEDRPVKLQIVCTPPASTPPHCCCSLLGHTRA